LSVPGGQFPVGNPRSSAFIGGFVLCAPAPLRDTWFFEKSAWAKARPTRLHEE
jgi:hypothetical protein